MQARKLIQEDELEALSDGDELTQARRAGLIFPGWLEGPLHFPPTYKFRHVPCPRPRECIPQGCLDIRRHFCNIAVSVSACFPITTWGCTLPQVQYSYCLLWWMTQLEGEVSWMPDSPQLAPHYNDFRIIDS